MTQREALNILKTGRSVFLTGAAGSGKTYVLNQYIKYLQDKGVGVGVTASTGIAATHMEGMTIHSWAGIGIKDVLTDWDLNDLEEKSYLRDRLQSTSVLIIDEVSMLAHHRLDLVDQVVRRLRKNSAPFGGLQVVLCGDFFQLPPVMRAGERETYFAYYSDAWKALDPAILYLEEQHRQSDMSYLKILNAIRNGEVDEELVQTLHSRFHKDTKKDEESTKLYSHNANVDNENERELGALSGRTAEYYMTHKGSSHIAETLKKNCLAPEILRVKEGARVMFVKNDPERRYANGTLGIVLRCDGGRLEVKMKNGKKIDVEPVSWKIEEDGKKKAEIIQHPLRLAWAITVHKSQGMSLDAAVVDLSRSFEPGMGYVALSRVRSLDGLSLVGLNEKALQVNSEVAEYDLELRERSAHHAREVAGLSAAKLNSYHDSFLESTAGASKKKKKKEKVSTVEQTKKMIQDGGSLREVADARGLTVGTILDHLEKIKDTDPKFDFSVLKGEMSQTRLKQITAALAKSGMEGGKYLLSPAKNILGSKFSFDEIRLGRLFMR